jgi:ribonucleoside-diphosphate reductase alpha chain
MDWLNDHARAFLRSGYLVGDITPEQRIRQIADRAQQINGISGFADKFFGYMERGYFSLASPVWSNFGMTRGLPISCFGSYIADDMGEILYTQAEIGMMSKLGGGTSGYFGALRPRGAPITDNGVSAGSVHFMQLFDKMTDIVSQGSTRRGQFAPYLPLEHPDAAEFLKIGTEGNPIQKLTHGVTVGDAWMQAMVDGDEQKRALWAKVIQTRSEIGYPYIFFTDNVNRQTVDVYRDKEMKIWASNLCTEIMLPSSADESFVCVLSSINLLHYDAWKDTDAVETLVTFLDAIVTEFIEKLEAYRDSEHEDDRKTFLFMRRAYTFAKRHRALGLGVLGWHSYLQSKMLPFEGKEAAKLNYEIFKLIKERAYAASYELAARFGEPEVLQGYGRRNTTLMAVAPTTSSAFILGQVSQGIEPVWSNCYVKDIQKIKTTIRNPFLAALLATKGRNDEATWHDIRDHDGSVQHLDCLTPTEKEVFLTYPEIDQMAIIHQAAVRQEFIDQGQSLNLLLHPDTPVKSINELYLAAWRLGIKTLYYQHSLNAAQQLNLKRACKACEA